MAMLLIGSLSATATYSPIAGILGSIFSVNTAVSIGLGLVQRALTPDQVIKQQGARLTESQFTTSVEGSPIMRITGRMRLGGQVLWATTFLETIVTSTETQGGKGGPRMITETTEYVYSTSFAIGLCEGGIGTTLGRIWADGKLLDLTNVTYRFYDGTQTLADPKIEAVEGAGKVPAYAGVAYIVFEDMVLTDFGNRIPQITCEINRSVSAGDAAAMEQSVEAVNIIPGSGEFILGTTAYSNDDGEGNTSTENSHSSAGMTDFVASMDRLGEYLPNVGSASLVVSWFGSTLNGATCEVRPKVDSATKTVTPTPWRVSNVTRDIAPVVSTISGSPAYGGTPSDVTVREAVIEMKARGLRVMFYPFLLMDMTGYPWRGHVTGGAATFLGTVTPAHYGTWADGSLPYSGPVEWSHRRMILHYAALMRDLMTAGDAFLIGSEMVGLTESDPAWGTGLASLIAAVKTILPAGVKVSYASDWSEYNHANLMPLWSSADFIGIDYYMPLTDWRTSDDEVYTVDHFKAGITSGEYWDYYYEDEAARLANTRTPITSAPFRQKDIISWRTAAALTAKPIWFTEFGCAAIDKGANQPNVFLDPKSSDSAAPWFSDGTRNDTVQRLYIEALLDYWRDSGLIDPANMFVWTWDARPYPSFPSLSNIWGDAENWQTGHWITGRLGTASLSDTVIELCKQIGYDPAKIDVIGLNGVRVRVRGLAQTSVSSPRTILDNLMVTFLFDAYEDGDRLMFISRAAPTSVTISLDDLVMRDKSSTYQRSRLKDTELPDRTKIDYLDELRDYNQASVDGHTVTGYSNRVSSFASVCVLDTDYARALADVLTQERWIGRDTVTFTLPFAGENVYLSVIKPGAVFEFQGFRYRVQKLTYGENIEVEAAGFSPFIYELVDHATSIPTNDSVVSYGSSLVEFAELPVRSSTDPNLWSPRVVARQKPWPGLVMIYKEDGSGGYVLNSTVATPAVIGETTTSLGYGAPWVWDNGNSVTVRLYDPADTLASASDLSVLNGANAIAVITPSGEWEVFQFADVVLNLDGTFTLSRLLRGQLGTEAYIGAPTPAGSRVVLYDPTRFSTLGGTSANLGLAMPLRYGPSSVLVADARYQNATITPRGVAYRPYAPAQLSQSKSGSDIVLGWVRRTRFDGDNWNVVEIPLNEEYERYEVEILNGPVVVRTVVVDNATALTYTAAQQTTDFGSTQVSVSWRVYQMSATFGRGSPANG